VKFNYLYKKFLPMKTTVVLSLCILFLLGISCKKKKDEHTVFAEFYVNGVHKKFENADSFSTSFCGASTWCGHFNYEILVYSKNYFKIGIPDDPVVGYVYTNSEAGFVVRYRDANEVEYELTKTPMNVTFTLWEGRGGWAEGTFSGWLEAANGDSVHIESGTFENMIQSDN